MDLRIELARARDNAIGAVAEFLDVPRDSVFDLAATWSERQRAMLADGLPADHYSSWQGENGRANICLNTIDQFFRTDVFNVVAQLAGSDLVNDLVDFGCGTAAVTYPYLAGLRSALLVDEPNMAQDLVRWRLARDGYQHVAIMGHEQTVDFGEDLFDFIICIDVMEHLVEPTAVFERFDRWLRPGGFYLHRAPWAETEADEREVGHLLCAPIDWHRSGGAAEQLAARYEELAPVSFGALYRKH